MKNNMTKGYTIIELSVVVAIMGLILGAVFAGKQVIDNARTHSVIADVQSYTKAMDDFQLQYNGLPGDIATISALPKAPNNPPSIVQAGNGDGDIDPITVTNDTTEALQFWLQLQLAGFLDKGIFNGTNSNPLIPATGGVVGNIPAGNALSSGYQVSSDVSHNVIINYSMITAGGPDFAIITPKDAYDIDQEIDDGIPATGNVISADGANTAGLCVHGAGASSVYQLSGSAVACQMNFQISKPPIASGTGSIYVCGGAAVGMTRINLSKSCPLGYTGDIIEECTPSGTWVIVRQTCTPVQCSGGMPYGSTRQIPCPDGYQNTDVNGNPVAANNTQICMDSGVWENYNPDPAPNGPNDAMINPCLTTTP